MDQRKGWRAAEKLLKQGRIQAALQQLSKISDAATGDVVTLNRLADLLAQQGKPAEAIGYYEKIAQRFESGGFIPKAVAIHKKILRLDPKRLESAIHLGQLYGRQKLLGEARKYLLHAANCYVEAREFAKAREVYERLVEAEPGELRHRVRLAQSRAAEGDKPKAVEELVWIGEAFLSGDAVADARTIFEHARELDPESEAALIGTARCCEAEGRADAALELLEDHVARNAASASAQGELARLYEDDGRPNEALELLRNAPLEQIPPDTWERMFRAALGRGTVEALWERMDPLFREQSKNGGSQSLLEMLSRLVDLEPNGHIPALLRQARLHEASGEVRSAVRALDALAAAYRARSMNDAAARVLERMREVAPPGEESSTSEPVIEQTAYAPEPEPEPEAAAAGAPPAGDAIPVAAEAPAVPLSPADEEFAAGRITQAEVLEKYELLPQALEQLDELVERFPGHVGGQERRVELLRAMEQTDRLAEALAALAAARRAAGDVAGAKKAASEAGSMRTLRTVSRRLLEKLQLIRPPAGPETTAREESEAAPPAAAPQPPPPRATRPAPDQAPAADLAPPSGGEVVIDLDDEEGATRPQPASPAAPGAAERPPAPEMIADIRHELQGGNLVDARRRLEALIVLGYSGAELEALRHDLEAAEAPVPAASPAVTDEDAGKSATPLESLADEDDALAAICAALDEELGVEREDPVVPAEAAEQGVDEIVAAFRERVEEEVGSEDHRTHYELGIGFKEMGLIEEAIGEFRIAANAPELKSEAAAMIAMCHREREELAEAIRWYREALESATADGETMRALRYDLAEVLLASGDAEAALIQFRDVRETDPDFRDVSGRVSELQNRLHS